MQKIKVGLVLLGLFAGLYYAQDVAAYCQCAEWKHEMKCRDYDELCPPPYQHIICMPAGCYDHAVCSANNCNAACGPGFYVCNNVCCPVGSGTSCQCGVKADGSCKPCVQGWVGPSCGGQTVLKCGSPKVFHDNSTTPTRIYERECYNNYWPASFECDDTECAGNPRGYCQDNCDCCMPTDEYQKTVIDGNTYTRWNDCRSPTRCNDWDDVYISYRQATGSERNVNNRCYNWYCYENPDNCNWSRHNNPDNWFYNVLTTCRTRVTTWNCVPTCNATAPSSLNFNSANSNLTWTPGSNGTSQRLYISRVQSDVINNCGTGTNCTVNANLSATTNLYPLSGLLDPGTVYYAKIVNYKDANCSASTLYNFTAPLPRPWWQARDGDVTANNDIRSLVPTSRLFNLAGLGGYPGVPVYGGIFNLTNTPNRISATSWNVNTTSALSRIFDYSYFKNLIPDEVKTNFKQASESSLKNEIGYVYDGYEWYKADGNLIINSDINFGSRKVIVFVENGRFEIGGRLNLNDGQGFLGVFVNGDITVSPTVSGSPSIEGIYLAQSSFSTGISTNQLHIRGSVASYEGMSLTRDLVDDSEPAEIFEFAPDQLLLFPDKLRFRRTKWAEIAP